jgi:AbrB family looped-hinge helix DNA binding protein
VKAILIPKIVTVSSKGQITIPVSFQRRYGFKPGQRVRITVRNDSFCVTPIDPIWSLKPFSSKRRMRREATRL